jgi:hypothetical protein
MQLVLEFGHQRGVQARIANVLGVSESTISRDIQATLYAPHVCQACGGYLPDGPLAMAFLDRLVEGAIILKIKGKSYRAPKASVENSPP